MSQHPSEIEMSRQQGAPQQKKGWFGRNWLWFVPLIIILPVLCCCGGGGALMWFGIGQIFEMPPYKDSLALAEQNPAVQQALGTPLDAPDDFFSLVSMMQDGGQLDVQNNGSQVDFIVEMPVSGPNGTGTLIVDAESGDGGVSWTYTQQEIHLNDGTVIDLLGNSP